MIKEKEYALVIDSEGNQLAPTKAEKAWFFCKKETSKISAKISIDNTIK